MLLCSADESSTSTSLSLFDRVSLVLASESGALVCLAKSAGRCCFGSFRDLSFRSPSHELRIPLPLGLLNGASRPPIRLSSPISVSSARDDWYNSSSPSEDSVRWLGQTPVLNSAERRGLLHLFDVPPHRHPETRQWRCKTAVLERPAFCSKKTEISTAVRRFVDMVLACWVSGNYVGCCDQRNWVKVKHCLRFGQDKRELDWARKREASMSNTTTG